ncbi:MAG: tRNA (adenosine(37)-N6)-dimethylallyltransferase MiaA [Chloroflexota bacterium]
MIPPARPVPPLLVLAGATATGKTGLAIRVAESLAAQGIVAEIISADSRQVFRGLDIGTAKATAEDRARVPHHGLDLVDPDQPFTVADYVTHARDVLGDIAGRAEAAGRGGLAILAGGTGLYLRAIARGLDTDALPSDAAIRARIETDLLESGLEASVERLQKLAPTLAAGLDLRNPRRVARALEIAEIRGDAPLPAPRGYAAPHAWVGLRVPPETHDAWIVARAREQFVNGLIEEAAALRERYDPALPAFSAIGYREAWSVLDGEATLDQAIATDSQRNRAFARRQRTWFRSEPDIAWMDPSRADRLPAIVAVARGLIAPAPPTRSGEAEAILGRP